MKKTVAGAPRRSNADMTADTRARILQAAIASLAECGYAETTMAGIGERVGVSRAALVYHFQSKNALMAATVHAVYDEFDRLYRAAALHPSLTPAEQLLALVDVSSQLTTSPAQMAQIELLLAARRDPVLRAEVAPAIEAREQVFDETWHNLATCASDKSGRLELLRDLGVSVLRGITISRSLAGDRPTFARQALVLRQLFLDAL